MQRLRLRTSAPEAPRRAASAEVESRSLGLLSGGLAATFLGRTFCRLLIDQPNGFVECHGLRVRTLRQGRMCGAIAHIRAIAAGHRLNVLAALRMLAQYGDRL